MQQHKYSRLGPVAGLLTSGWLMISCGGGSGGATEPNKASAALVPVSANGAASAASAASQPASDSASSATAPASEATAGHTSTTGTANILAVKPSLPSNAAPATPAQVSVVQTPGAASAAEVAPSQIITGTGATVSGSPTTSSSPTQLTGNGRLSAADPTVAAASSNIPAPTGSCQVNEVRNLTNSCSIVAVGLIESGKSLSFSNTKPGYVGEQTAACSAGKLVWLPATCATASGSGNKSASAAPPSQASNTGKIPLSLQDLQQLNADFKLNHEGKPKGVPDSYDWYLKPKVDAWNNAPSNYSAVTGWGQAFWTSTTSSANAYLQLAGHQTLICHGTTKQWTRVQSNSVEGGEYNPDFQNNTNVAAPFFAAATETNVVGWSTKGAYHFWPAGGRAALPSGPICGVLVLVQARAVPVTEGSYKTPTILLGLGADYWLNKTAPWNNYLTNTGVGVGRLKLVSTGWTWFGFSTASDTDLASLSAKGYTDQSK